VLIAELLDRSYRTVKQLRTSLGIPVIEGIDEIVTRVLRRRRLVHRFLLMPTMAMLAVGAMFLAGALAYLSVESPGDYEMLKSSPQRVLRLFIGRS
jgi:hypothetical protein